MAHWLALLSQSKALGLILGADLGSGLHWLQWLDYLI